MKLRILVVRNPIKITSPVNPSTSMVSPTSYSPSVIIENPAIKSFAKSWNANPIIAVPIPNPAKIDYTLIPNTERTDNKTKIIMIYFTIFVNNIPIVLILCF